MNKKQDDHYIKKGRDVYDNVMIILTVITVFLTGLIGFTANDLNKRNQALIISEVTLNDENDKYYTFALRKEQGEVKKAYLVTSSGDSKYKKLDLSLGDIQIPKEALGIHTASEENGDDSYSFSVDWGDMPIYDALDFAVALLDYSNRWSCYYVMIRPGINLSNAYLTIKVHQKGVDDPVGEATAKTIPVEAAYKILDTDFLNKDIVDAFLKEFTAFYEVQILEDDMTIDVNSIDDNGNIQKGTVTKKKTINIKYKDFDAEEILNNINTIRSACN